MPAATARSEGFRGVAFTSCRPACDGPRRVLLRALRRGLGFQRRVAVGWASGSPAGMGRREMAPLHGRRRCSGRGCRGWPEQRLQVLERRRLGHVRVEASLARVGAVLRLGVTAQGDDPRLAGRWRSARHPPSLSPDGSAVSRLARASAPAVDGCPGARSGEWSTALGDSLLGWNPGRARWTGARTSALEEAERVRRELLLRKVSTACIAFAARPRCQGTHEDDRRGGPPTQERGAGRRARAPSGRRLRAGRRGIIGLERLGSALTASSQFAVASRA